MNKAFSATSMWCLDVFEIAQRFAFMPSVISGLADFNITIIAAEKEKISTSPHYSTRGLCNAAVLMTCFH